MSTRYDCTDPDAREDGMRHAQDALARGELVVLPTDTVYGLAADAFSADAVAALLAAKGRTRAMPPPVLVSDVRTLDGLAMQVPPAARELAEAFWPGALTLVCRAQPSLRWDLGETHGTVAVRVPDHDLTRRLLRATGPLAVSSANLTGHPAAADAAGAEEQLGDAVSVYLDGGPAAAQGDGAQGDGVQASDVLPAASVLPSTIVDVTGEELRVVRVGAISVARLREVVPGVVDPSEPPAPAAAAPAAPAAGSAAPAAPTAPVEPAE